MEKVMKEKNDYYNEQLGKRGRGINEKTSTPKARTRGLIGTTIITTVRIEASKPTISNAYGKMGHYAQECHSIKRCYHYGIL